MEEPMEKTYAPTVAGILDITAGASSLCGSVALGILAGVSGILPKTVPCGSGSVALFSTSAMFSGLAIMLLITGILAVFGGIAALQRRRWLWAVIGAIAAVFCFAPFGVASIVLTVMAEKEFRKVSHPGSSAGTPT
jgi:hypothetical protein